MTDPLTTALASPAVTADGAIVVRGVKRWVSLLLDLAANGKATYGGVTIHGLPRPTLLVNDHSIVVGLHGNPIATYTIDRTHPRFEQVHSLLSGQWTDFGDLAVMLPPDEPLGDWRASGRRIVIAWDGGAAVSRGLGRTASLKSVTIDDNGAFIDLEHWAEVITNIDQRVVWADDIAPEPSPTSAWQRDLRAAAKSDGIDAAELSAQLESVGGWARQHAAPYAAAFGLSRRQQRQERARHEQALLRCLLTARGVDRDTIDGVMRQEAARFRWLGLLVSVVTNFVIPPQYRLVVKVAVWLAGQIIDRMSEDQSYATELTQEHTPEVI